MPVDAPLGTAARKTPAWQDVCGGGGNGLVGELLRASVALTHLEAAFPTRPAQKDARFAVFNIRTSPSMARRVKC